MSIPRDFAKIIRASDGRQVIVFVELDDGDYQLRIATHFDGVMVMAGLGFDSADEERNEQAAYALLEAWGLEQADKWLAGIEKMFQEDVADTGMSKGNDDTAAIAMGDN